MKKPSAQQVQIDFFLADKANNYAKEGDLQPF